MQNPGGESKKDEYQKYLEKSLQNCDFNRKMINFVKFYKLLLIISNNFW